MVRTLYLWLETFTVYHDVHQLLYLIKRTTISVYMIRFHTDFNLWVFFITIIFIALTFLKNKLFKLFISLECKYNKLQFGIRISSIEVSKQNLHISLALYVYNTTYSKEIRPGAIPFSRT